MKTNPNDPVAPVTEWIKDKTSDTGFRHSTIPGLTKREYFAAMAMQGILPVNDIQIDFVAQQAVKFADALISALNETSTSTP